jgi:hypothetical protein
MRRRVAAFSSPEPACVERSEGTHDSSASLGACQWGGVDDCVTAWRGKASPELSYCQGSRTRHGCSRYPITRAASLYPGKFVECQVSDRVRYLIRVVSKIVSCWLLQDALHDRRRAREVCVSRSIGVGIKEL